MTEAQVLAYLRKNPKSRCEQIAAAHEEQPAIVSVHLRALHAAGKVKREGNTRGTRWSAK